MEEATGNCIDEGEISSDCRYQRVCSRQTDEILSKSDIKVTYRATNYETGCQVSWHEINLKQLPAEAVNKVWEDFERIRSLQHENVISWLDMWYKPQSRSMVYITELIPEASLRQCLQRTGIPRLKVLRQWLTNILDGLVYLHSQSPPVIHGNLTLSNLYVVPHTGVVKIGGLGKTLVAHLMENEGEMPDHPEYMSPEAIRDIKTPAGDIYTLGMSLLEICTKETPYQECSTPAAVVYKVLSGRKPISFSRIIDEDVTDFIEQCLKPVSERATASQLLSSNFLHKELRRADSSLVLREPLSPTEPDNSTVRLELLLPSNTPGKRRKISFHFDLGTDSPESVAVEMVKELELPEDMTPSLTREITEKMYMTFSQMTDIPTPSTSVASVSTEDESDIKRGKIPEESDIWPHRITPVALSPEPKVTDLTEEEKKQLQLLLSERYNITLPGNGVMNKKTEALVRRAQEDFDQEVTGVMTTALWTALQKQRNKESDKEDRSRGCK